MLYKFVIFLATMFMLTGTPPSTGTTKRVTPSMYTIGGQTVTAIEDKLNARVSAANDTLIGQFSTPNQGTSVYSFKTYVTSPRCDSLKVYVDGTKVYTYNYTTTGWVSHSFTFTSKAITPQTVKFVTIYGDTTAGSWYLQNLNIRQ